MNYKEFRDQIEDFKRTSSCVDYMSAQGFNIPHDGTVIIAPHQFRADDHSPSFAVYHSHAFDFGTHTLYDIFDLDMTLHYRTFMESVYALTGLSFSSPQLHYFSSGSNERKKLQDNIQKWHQLLLSNPKVFRTAQNREEGPLDYLLDRKLTLEYIKKETIGYNPDKQQIVFPYRKNGQIVYAVGRDFSGRAELPKNDPRRGDAKKYQKFFITPGLDHCPWGLHTLRGMSAQRRMYKAADNELYEAPPTDDPKEDTLIICEGMVDASVFAQNNWQVLSPVCGDFRKSQINEVLSICRMFRTVFICFDNDGKGTEFQRNWARRLFEAKINFVCGHTAPAGTPKLDVADYYVQACISGGANSENEQKAGQQALYALVRNAVPGVVEISQSMHTLDKVARFVEQSARFARPYDMLMLRNALASRKKTVYNPDGTEALAPLFSKYELTYIFQEGMRCPPEQDTAREIADAHTLTYSVDDAFYEFNGSYWEKKHEHFIRRYVYSALGRKSGDNRVGKVVRTMKTLLADTRPFDEKHVFTFANGTLLLDEDDETGLPGRLVPSSPEYRTTIHVGYSYIPGARNRDWEKFIDDVCMGNTALARELQKACGSVLMSDNSLHKMYYLIGDGRNGKSTLLSVLCEVFGRDNGSNVRPDRMGEEFAPIAMKGKLYNICYEGGRYLKGAEENLKSIVAGDPIMASHKGVDAITFTPRAKIFVAANNMFNARDVSEGFLSRFIFLPFLNTYQPGDPDLPRKLCSDLPGIFNWCLEGYRLLKKEGFRECAVQKESRQRFVEHIEPLRIFMRETFTRSFMRRPLGDAVQYSAYPSLKELYKCYKEWSMDGGFSYTNRGIFAERLKFLAPRLERAEGLEKIGVEVIDGTDCLVLQEMDSDILSARECGADNESHAALALSHLKHKAKDDANDSVQKTARETPPSHTEICEQGTRTQTAKNVPAETCGPNIFRNADVIRMVTCNEPLQLSQNFTRAYINDPAVNYMLKEKGLLDIMPSIAAYALAVTHLKPDTAWRMPLNMVLALHNALDKYSEYKFARYEEWEQMQAARLAKACSTWSAAGRK